MAGLHSIEKRQSNQGPSRIEAEGGCEQLCLPEFHTLGWFQMLSLITAGCMDPQCILIEAGRP